MDAGVVKGRYRQLVRCLQLQQETKNRQITAAYLRLLAERHAVSTRTVRRDLRALQAAGVSVRYGSGCEIGVR